MRQRRRNRLAHDGEDDDPMSVVSNLEFMADLLEEK